LKHAKGGRKIQVLHPSDLQQLEVVQRPDIVDFNYLHTGQAFHGRRRAGAFFGQAKLQHGFLLFSGALLGVKMSIGKDKGQTQAVDSAGNRLHIHGVFENVSGSEFGHELEGNNNAALQGRRLCSNRIDEDSCNGHRVSVQ
jgi:hypothetical protein